MELKDLNLNEEQLAAVQKLIQGEGDRVRTEYSKKNKELADELAQYKPKEKSPEEISLEERIAALEKREKEIAAKEKTAQIGNELKSKGIPDGLAKYLSADANVEEVAKLLNANFQESNFKPDNHGGSDHITKEQFRKMGYAEKAKLFSENPTLFEALSK